MKNRCLFLLVCLLFLSSLSLSQTKPLPENPIADPSNNEKIDSNDFKLILDITLAETTLRLCAIDSSNKSCAENPSKKLADLYAQALQKPETSKLLFAKLLKDYQELRESARSAPQVSQSADEANIKMQMVIMTQNQKIIELLEQLIKKK